MPKNPMGRQRASVKRRETVVMYRTRNTSVFGGNGNFFMQLGAGGADQSAQAPSMPMIPWPSAGKEQTLTQAGEEEEEEEPEDERALASAGLPPLTLLGGEEGQAMSKKGSRGVNGEGKADAEAEDPKSWLSPLPVTSESNEGRIGSGDASAEGEQGGRIKPKGKRGSFTTSFMETMIKTRWRKAIGQILMPGKGNGDDVAKVMDDDDEDTVALEWSESERRDPYILHPLSKTKALWDSFIIGLALYVAVLTPWSLAFQMDDECDKESGEKCYPQFFVVCDVLVDIFFAMDVVLGFRTGYVNESSEIILEAQLCARHYLHGWFPIDLFASIPFYEIVNAFHSLEGSGNLLLLKLFKLNRLFRLGRLLKHMRDLAYANAFRLIKLLVAVLMFGHWVACIWWWLGLWQIEHLSNQGENAFTGKPWILHHDLLEADLVTAYSTSLYFGISMLCSVEFGYVQPQTNIERSFGTITLLLGAVCTAFIFGNVAVLIQSFDAANYRHQHVLDTLNEFLSFHDLSHETKDRIRGQIEYWWSLTNGLNAHTVLQALPESTRGEVLMELQKDLLTTCKLFEDCHKAFVKRVACLLRPLSFLPGDFIVHEGDYGREIYFVCKGKVAVRKQGKQTARLMHQGSYFGEMAYFFGARRSTDVAAYTFCQLLVMHDADLDTLFKVFPDDEVNWRQKAEVRRNIIFALEKRSAPRDQEKADLPLPDQPPHEEISASDGGAE